MRLEVLLTAAWKSRMLYGTGVLLVLLKSRKERQHLPLLQEAKVLYLIGGVIIVLIT